MTSPNLQRGDRVEELKPCPFCGSTPLFAEPAPDNWHTYGIICEGCPKPLRPVACISEDREEAVAAWNRRQSPEAVTVVYREIFDEITLKAKPLCEDESDPERVTAYRIPVGPIHRACGKVHHHMLGIEQNVNAAIAGLRKYEMSDECKRDIESIEQNMREALRDAPNTWLR